jgi:hypothetical protein
MARIGWKGSGRHLVSRLLLCYWLEMSICIVFSLPFSQLGNTRAFSFFLLTQPLVLQNELHRTPTSHETYLHPRLARHSFPLPLQSIPLPLRLHF